MQITRRDLLIGGAAGTLALSLRSLVPARSAAATEVAAAPAYTSYDDLYRQAWRWDRVVRGTHLRANCFSACAWDLYVKEGVVWREEQADVYERDVPGLSDYAPRGCQKGACYSGAMLNSDRVTYPLERVGPRGSGRWRRVTWDHALTRIADAILDANAEGGSETVIYDNGTSNVDMGPSTFGEMRLFNLLGATQLESFGGTGDLAMGAFQTWGTSFVDGSSDDWMRSDTLVLWHCNPLSTRIPDAHFISEAAYSGTRVVTVTPDYSPSAIHASLWINPRPGTDAALALGVARGILERGAVDEAYVREQTDLPFLVREDTGRFLRQSDLEEGGADDVFFLHDLATGELVAAPGTWGQSSDSIELDGIEPALEGSFEVETLGGSVEVRPMMERLRERVAEYTPARVRELTGVGEQTQERLTELIATSRRTLYYPTWGSNKSYHADLLHRSLILLSALRGQQGKTGSGVRFAAWLSFSGGNDLMGGPQPSWLQRLILRFYTPPPRTVENAIAGASPHMRFTPSHLFLHAHGGLDSVQDADSDDPNSSRPASAHLREAIDGGWIRVRPPEDRPPRVLVMSGVNPLRRWPSPQVIERVLWPKLKLIVAIDFRLSSTGMKSDLVLPGAGYYEKAGIKYAVALAPYVVVGERAVQPLGESKSEWEISWLLAQRIQERAIERGMEGDLATLGDRFGMEGTWGPHDDEALIDHILTGSTITGGVGWEEARKAGAIPIASVGGWGTTNGIGSEVEPGGSITPSRVHVEEKHAWPTLTGRQQFYLDHDWFREVDEALPRFKPAPLAGGSYPILLSGGHTRWSIHAIWRSYPDMLRLQRGAPSMWMSEEDARARGIADGERVRVRNDHGSFHIAARLSPAVPPGEAIIYHAWEPYQFEGWRGNMEVFSAPYKQTHFVGDYGHVRYRLYHAGPVHTPRGFPVEIERDVSGAV